MNLCTLNKSLCKQFDLNFNCFAFASMQNLHNCFIYNCLRNKTIHAINRIIVPDSLTKKK